MEALIRLDGKVIVEGEEVGLLKGFEFIPSLSEGEKAGPILSAARKILPKEIERRVRELLMSDNAAFKFDDDGSILWQNNNVAKLTNGETLYLPKIIITNSEFLSDEQIKQIEIRVNEAVEGNIENILSETKSLSFTEGFISKVSILLSELLFFRKLSFTTNYYWGSTSF